MLYINIINLHRHLFVKIQEYKEDTAVRANVCVNKQQMKDINACTAICAVPGIIRNNARKEKKLP